MNHPKEEEPVSARLSDDCKQTIFLSLQTSKDKCNLKMNPRVKVKAGVMLLIAEASVREVYPIPLQRAIINMNHIKLKSLTSIGIHKPGIGHITFLNHPSKMFHSV